MTGKCTVTITIQGSLTVHQLLDEAKPVNVSRLYTFERYYVLLTGVQMHGCMHGVYIEQVQVVLRVCVFVHVLQLVVIVNYFIHSVDCDVDFFCCNGCQAKAPQYMHVEANKLLFRHY